MVACSVTATSGISAAGSPLAIEPPMVPRPRVGAWPTQGSARASSGTLRCTMASRSATACRVVAPMTTPSPSSRMPASSAMRAMSISRVGRASRMASMGISVCPPAMTRVALVGGQQRAGLARRSSART